MSRPSLIIQRRRRWLGHAHRMEPDRLATICYMAAKCQSRGFKGGSECWSPGYMQESGEERMCSLCMRFHKAPLCHLQQRLPLQDWATQSYKILPKSPALTIASSRQGHQFNNAGHILPVIFPFTFRIS